MLLHCQCVWADGDWSHPFADVAATASLQLTPQSINTLKLFDLQQISLPTELIGLRCADVTGDGFQDLLGTTVDQKAIWLVDFMKRSVKEIPVSLNHEDHVYLSALVDADQDQVNDILYTILSSTGSSTHCVFGVEKENTIITVQGDAEVVHERAFTLMDVNFDTQTELITYGMQRDTENGFIGIYDLSSGNLLMNIELESAVSPSTFAIVRDEFFEETRFFLATQPGDDSISVPSRSSWIHAFVIAEGFETPIELWSKQINPKLIPSRLCVGNTNDERETVVLGTRRAENAEPETQKSIVEFHADSGEIVNELVIGSRNCHDLAVGNLNDDAETEIVFLDDKDDLHRIDFSRMRDRIMTLALAEAYLGIANLRWYPYPGNLAIQKIGSRYIIHFLNDHLDPIVLGGYPVSGQIIGRPILGDVDGNGCGEVIFISNNGTPKANRVFFYDPDAAKPENPDSAISDFLRY